MIEETVLETADTRAEAMLRAAIACQENLGDGETGFVVACNGSCGQIRTDWETLEKCVKCIRFTVAKNWGRA